jgi:hypothetical protein
LTLLTRSGCHLCDEARATVSAVAAAAGEDWMERDVDGESGLSARFGEYVPVVLVDGIPHGYWRIDADRLRLALRRPASPPRTTPGAPTVPGPPTVPGSPTTGL